MQEYTKINTLYKRDASREGRNRIIPGEWATPEIGYLALNQWRWTEKVNGTNIRVRFARLGDKYSVEYGGRTDQAMLSTHLLAHLDAIFRSDEGLERLAAQFSGGVTLYGEGYGSKIQNEAQKYAPLASFALFDVLADSEEGPLWLERHNVTDIGDALGIPVVPVIGEGHLIDMAEVVKDGLESRYGSFVAEGIVARPLVELQTRRGERIITKIKHKDFTQLARLEAGGAKQSS